MAVNAINNNATSNTAGAASALPADPYNSLSSQDFMKILFTELGNQDPTKPQDTQSLLNQLSTIRSIESNASLTDQLQKLVSQSQFASAGSLIGKTVTGLDEQHQAVQGLVKSVGLENNNVILTLDSGARVPFDNLESVTDAQIGQQQQQFVQTA